MGMVGGGIFREGVIVGLHERLLMVLFEPRGVSQDAGPVQVESPCDGRVVGIDHIGVGIVLGIVPSVSSASSHRFLIS